MTELEFPILAKKINIEISEDIGSPVQSYNKYMIHLTVDAWIQCM